MENKRGETSEPRTKYSQLKVKDYWKRGRVERTVKVASGRVPSHEELPPAGEEEHKASRMKKTEPMMGSVPLSQVEESARKHFPNIEDSLPTGDRD